MITLEERKAEIHRNYRAFKEMLPSLMAEHSGKFVLLRDKKIIDYFDSSLDAIEYADKEYTDGMYSIQEVTDRVVDLGYFSHVPNRLFI